MIREDILQKFPELFGTKTINGRTINVEETISVLTRDLGPEIAAALTARRKLLESAAAVREKYAWPKWDDSFEDPVTGRQRTFRQIVQGLIDNFLGRDSELGWRLNDEVPIPDDAHPTANPGLELTGPWHPLDMAFNALNSQAPQNMPDFEDASPAHFQPDGTPKSEPIGIFPALQNAKDIFEGRWSGRPYEVVKKGQARSYKINRPPSEWPTRFVRPPSIHIRFDYITINGEPVPGVVAIVLLWTLNNYEALRRLGTGVYYYIPKIQTPQEALIIEKLDRKSTRLNSSHLVISYAVFCLKKKNTDCILPRRPLSMVREGGLYFPQHNHTAPATPDARRLRAGRRIGYGVRLEPAVVDLPGV